MYPRLTFDLQKINENLSVVSRTVKSAGCSLMIVTKAVCADHHVCQLIDAHPGVDFFADSRVDNLKACKEFSKGKVLLRLTQAWEVPETIRFADISFQSEWETILKLEEEAARQKKSHKIVLMIDLGDLREGIFYQQEEEIFETVKEILSLNHIELYGLGVNLTCYGAVIPKNDNLSLLVDLARRLEGRYSIKLPMISGGNSSSYYLIEKKELPEGINNLRLGEAFLLGNETAYGDRIPGTHNDAIFLEAQIIELKSKPSLPIGEIGVDAFGQKPSYEDLGVRKRAILAIGKQDADPDSMTPTDPDIHILGASSDHLILDVTDSLTDWKVGDIVSFTLGYSGLLKASTSSYVKRYYFTSGRNDP
ncbi:MAG: alanine racemase [Firmicutes bacterium HGW-Firmicutes-11]|jgi:predicted amino acid racemase|nr:MAG: alanine racemase [Firmicutes bacterium HGW-Firmicutes-11]